MKINYGKFASALGSLLLTLLCAPQSKAQCGGLRTPAPVHSSWQLQPGQARLLQASVEPNQEIIGMWHIRFRTLDSPGIPDNTEVDAGYSQWHSDGTEIMNSGGRSPITSSFCLGTWKKVGEHEYKLDHFAIAWDATGENLVGPGNIQEDVIVDHDQNHFTGTFTIDQYDESMNKLAHLQGVITGSRIEVGTPVGKIF